MTQQNLGGPAVEEITDEDIQQWLPSGDDASDDTDDDNFDPAANVQWVGNEPGESSDVEDEDTGEAAEPPAPEHPAYDFSQEIEGQPAQQQSQGVDPRVAEAIYQQNQELRNRQVAQQINQEVGQIGNQYVRYLVDEEGWTPQQAHQMAQTQVGQLAQGMYQRYHQVQQAGQLEQAAKAQIAQLAGQYFGVDPQYLMVYNDPNTMIRAAHSLGLEKAKTGRATRAAQTARRAAIPPQNYDRGGRSRGTMSDAELLDAYNNGAPVNDRIRGALKRAGILA